MSEEPISLSYILVFIMEILLKFWDIVSLPIYLLFQHTPASETERTWAKIVEHKDTEITIRAVPMVNKVKEDMKGCKEEINTMDKLFNYSCGKFSSKQCLGTREVLGETEERQVDGKEFIKLQLGDYSWLTYTDLNIKAEQMGRGLRELGVEPLDNIVLYANTCADWMVTALASFKHSLAVVTIYANLGEEGVEHGISQTKARTVVVGQEHLPRLLSLLPRCPTVKNVIIIPNHNPAPKPTSSDVSFHLLPEVISLGSSSTLPPHPPHPSTTAIIMYTSGSTGTPKGVVLTHQNLVQAIHCLLPTAGKAVQPIRPTDCYIAMLPLAHVMELLAENMMMVLGIPIGYSSPKTFTDTGSGVAKGSLGDASVLKPSLVCVVPLLLDTIYKGIKNKVAAKGPFVRQLLNMCIRYRMKWVKRGQDTPIMNLLIFSKFKAIVGGQVRTMISGGAPLAPAVQEYVRACLGVTLLQGYGLTETCATACIPDSGDLSTGRVGPPLQEVDIRLVNWEEGGYMVTDQCGPRGEVVIGGEHLAKEYYEMPEKTKEEFYHDGGKRWFRTGDIGHMMTDGTIKIIDRKKDLVKLQCGEYVSLGKVESLMKIHPAIENICVCADPTKDHTVALVVPGQGYLDTVAKELGLEDLSRDSLCSHEDVVAGVLSVMVAHGTAQRLVRFEIPRAVFLVSQAWTPESGLLTAAMKLKREDIRAVYREHIGELYEGNNNAGGIKNMCS